VKLKVIKRFRDKYTKKVYEANKFYETDDKERAEFLIKSGYCQEVKRTTRKKADEK
jgi:hypothetical protein